MFRAMLVALKPAAPPPYFVLDYAVNLAERHHWEVTGLSVIDEARLAPPEPVPLGASDFKLHRDEQRIAAARQAAQEVSSALATACRAKSVTNATHVHDGEVVQLLGREARAVDLMMCGHTPGGDSHEQSLLHAILKHCPRPAIVVPQAAFSGESILLAYDASAQAARALASLAGSGLAEGRAVHVLALHQDTAQADATAQEAAQFLGRHGISAQPRGQQLARDAARHILEEAARVDAGLIALGAFGKNIVQEFFFGSVTRSVLSSLPLPVFIDH